jgi:hypothetical protein
VWCAGVAACASISFSAIVHAQTSDAAAAPGAAATQAVQDAIAQLKAEFEAKLAALEAQLAAASGATGAAGSPAGAAAAPGADVAPAGAGGGAAQTPQPPAPGSASPGGAVPAAQPTAPVPAGTEGAGGPSGSLPVYGAGASASKAFNPDIAVIGDFLGASGKNSMSTDPVMQMHESEASFQAVVDPYARADFFISFGEEGVDLEEGFVTFPALPGGLLMRAGKMRAAFGKVNSLHNHVLPWTDRPLVTSNLVGGEDGIDDAGISIARLIPNPWLFLEATGQVFRGESGDLFQTSRRRDLTYVGHLRGYQDITESTNIDLGASFAHGHNTPAIPLVVQLGGDAGSSDAPAAAPLVIDYSKDFTTDLYGIDATIRWKPLQRAIYHSFLARSEVIWSRRDVFAGRQKSMGYYVSGDYQFARRWFAGIRYDNSDRADNASLTDAGESFLVTYWPSEFSQVRGQFRRTDYADGPTANEFLFQFQFSIGAHGAHPF